MKKIIDFFSCRKSSLITKKDEIYSEGKKVSQEIFETMFESDPERTQILLEKLYHLSDIYHLTEKIISHTQDNEKNNHQLAFAVGTKFLYECYEYLTSMGKNEVFHYVTGMKLGNVFTLDNMQKVKLKEQSYCGAVTEEQSTAEAIIAMDRFGHNLHATFHSHPVGITHPSSTDLDDLRGLLQGGHKLIGAIFTMDGFLRFYSIVPFELIIYGKGLEKINENFYKLTKSN
jgi:proteasome lid subunit RPN8/RPN11